MNRLLSPRHATAGDRVFLVPSCQRDSSSYILRDTKRCNAASGYLDSGSLRGALRINNHSYSYAGHLVCLGSSQQRSCTTLRLAPRPISSVSDPDSRNSLQNLHCFSSYLLLFFAVCVALCCRLVKGCVFLLRQLRKDLLKACN